jgi:transglycosylase-like protein
MLETVIAATATLALTGAGHAPAHHAERHAGARPGAVSSAPTSRTRWTVVRPYNAKLDRIADCESSGRWFIATGNGFYGGLQFTLQTWWSVGGRGMPHRNSILEQKYRAVKVFLRRGSWADWPVCGFV